MGCSSSSEKSIECWFTNDNGAVTYSDQFASINGKKIERLQIAPGDMSDFRLYSQRLDAVIHIIRLEDGTILAPVQYKSEFPAIQTRVAEREKAKSAS
jgi:hypothetical protein